MGVSVRDAWPHTLYKRTSSSRTLPTACEPAAGLAGVCPQRGRVCGLCPERMVCDRVHPGHRCGIRARDVAVLSGTLLKSWIMNSNKKFRGNTLKFWNAIILSGGFKLDCPATVAISSAKRKPIIAQAHAYHIPLFLNSRISDTKVPV